MAALGCGLVAQDQFAEFNEAMKERLGERDARETFRMKTGYKEGVIRIWSKMAEYQPISLIK